MDAWVRCRRDRIRETPQYYIRDGGQVWVRDRRIPKLSWVKPIRNVDELLHDHDDDKYEYRRSRLAPGEYNPRIWQIVSGRSQPPIPAQALSSSVAAVSNLAVRFSDVCRFVEPEPQNDGTFGHELRELLLLCAMEVEAGFRCVLRENGYPGKESGWNRKDYQKLLAPMHLREWELRLSSYPSYPAFRPFDDWTESGGLSWYTAYNHVKHDREGRFAEVTLAQAIQSLAGALLVVVGQFGPQALGLRSWPGGEYLSEHPQFRAFILSGCPSWKAGELVVPPMTGQKWVSVPYFGAQ